MTSCCINKADSAELTEAINSMFLWYERAKVCYAYLSDVRGARFDVEFGSSRWFTRGWTLQELLAPKLVKFYNNRWEFLGSKYDLARTISGVAQVSEEVLRRPELLRRASIAKRMSWASDRKTTRLEDMAYSLLGIFQVNMPLLYGEGDRAFLRLQEEILRTTVDHSIFAWGFSGVLPRDQLYEPVSTAREFPLLAKTPRDFINSSEIVPFDTGLIDPYVMTNKGLQITLPIVSSSNHFIGLLNCRMSSNQDFCVGIRLQTYQAGGDAYSRTGQNTGSSSTHGNTHMVPLELAAHATMKKIFINHDSYSPRSIWFLQNQPLIVMSMSETFAERIGDPLAVLPRNVQWNAELKSVRFSNEEGWVAIFFGYVEAECVSILIRIKQDINFGAFCEDVQVLRVRRQYQHWLRTNNEEKWLEWARKEYHGRREPYRKEDTAFMYENNSNISARLEDGRVCGQGFTRLRLDYTISE
jgi:hypothetical protein